MTSPKIQFRCPPELHASLSERTREGVSESDTARTDLARYYELIRYALADLDLAEAEAHLICDALNGVWLADITTPSQAKSHVCIGVEDAIRLNAAAKKWCVDGDKILAMLRSLDDWHTMALMDAVSRFWRGEQTVQSVGLVR